jgi:hypothetical protein
LLITPAYGGYYFSPKQALELDALRATLPRGENRSLACAALIQAASECAAAPGHTAQPFKPSPTASKFLFELWKRSIFQKTYDAFSDLGQQHARTPGSAHVHDAVTFAANLNENDVAFIDPPYSGVHYSRFYHVLETIARGQAVTVSGEGRYPPPSQRPRSDFSVSTRSRIALDELLRQLSENGVRSIMTFPRERTSNNLSGAIVEEVAGQYFNIQRQETVGRFSTLGGNLRHRTARMPADEIILVMQPR